MPELFQSFHPRVLESPFASCLVNGQRVEYLALAQPENAHLPPVLILPGVFQDFRSLLFEARRLLLHRPVLMTALPGQGGNAQLAPGAGVGELAGLLAGFVNALGIRTVLPLAFSYGAVIGYVFCANYPAQVERAILGGIFHEIPPAFHEFLVKARNLLNNNHMDDFATHLTQHMINQEALAQTGISQTFQKNFHLYLKSLAEIEKQRYLQNINRLIDLDTLPGNPAVRALLYGGRQDNFAPPELVRKTAEKFPDSIFAIIEGADHMVAATKKKTLERLFCGYIAGDRPGEIEGVSMEFPPAASAARP